MGFDIEGGTTCPKCGQQVSADESYCSFCGSSVPRTTSQGRSQGSRTGFDDEDGTTCPKCAHHVPAGNAYCGF
ncbi:MAG: zinc ribbon domain-containing protein, partial [Candidatus Thorarchaeota archaeon]